MKDLKLVLTHKWYDMIEDEIKPEEYRKPSPFWIKRIFGKMEPINSDGDMELFRLTDKDVEQYRYDVYLLQKHVETGVLVPLYKDVTFQRAYPKNPPRMTWGIRGYRIGVGNTEWGAMPRVPYVVIMLGKRKKPAE